MGIWSHVDCVINIDSKNAIEDFTEIFGKEIYSEDIKYSSYSNKDQYWADYKKIMEKEKLSWDDYKNHPEQYLPVGSEGSLHIKSRLQTRVKNTLYPYRYKVEIYGGLREHYNADKVIDHIRNGINKLRKNCCIKVSIKVCNDLYGWFEYNHEDRYYRDLEFYRHIEYGVYNK